MKKTDNFAVSIIVLPNDSVSNIEESINTLLKQTFSDIELIITGKDNNHTAMLNKAIQACHGKYICISDVTINNVPDRIEKQVAFMEEHPDIGISGIPAWYFWGSSLPEVYKILSLQQEQLSLPSLIIRKEFIDRNNLTFNEHYQYAYAYEFLMNAMRYFPVRTHNEILIERASPAPNELFFKECNQIRLEQIQYLGIEPLQEQIHLSLMGINRKLFTKEEYEQWIDCILSANRTKQYYQDTLLQTFLNNCLWKKIKETEKKDYNIGESEMMITKYDTNVLMACPSTLNPYVDTLIKGILSPNYFVEASSDYFWETERAYDIIHIHWPEALFNWNIPTKEDIISLTNTIKRWKQKGTKIVHTYHDEIFHYTKQEEEGKQFFDSILSEADAIIHLGVYSKEQLQAKNKIPGQRHYVVPHHIYDALHSEDIPANEAKRMLGISPEKFVILAFGAFRDIEEQSIIKESFDVLDIPDKFLLAPSWNHSSWSNNYTKMITPSQDNCFFGNLIVEEDMVPYYFSAADVVFLQRVRTLNSGNLPMAFSYNKTVVGPQIGNINEYLDNVNNFSFNPFDIQSVVKSLELAYVRSQSPQTNKQYAYQNWKTSKIAEVHKKVYSELLKQ